MKLTLLRVVQDTCRAMQGFNVDSIFETDESEDIAYIAERMYYHLVQRFNNIGWTGAVGTLEGLGDTTRPTHMRIPENVQRIQDSLIQYNQAKANDGATVFYKNVEYVEPEYFLRISANRVDGNDNTLVVNDPSGVEFVVLTDQAPTYCTSFDQEYIVFDSYDSEEDTTLQQTKTRLTFTKEEVFLVQDEFEIPIPSHLSTLYQDLVTSESMRLLRQMSDDGTERRARAAMIRMQQKDIVGGQVKRKTYGRR